VSYNWLNLRAFLMLCFSPDTTNSLTGSVLRFRFFCFIWGTDLGEQFYGNVTDETSTGPVNQASRETAAKADAEYRPLRNSA
jgi:hypothetical protein